MRREESAQFFAQILPAMVRLALNLPNLVTTPLPLLTKLENQSSALDADVGDSRIQVRRVTLSQQQCACLLANAFFCTFPRRNTTPRHGQPLFPSINFNTYVLSARENLVLIIISMSVCFSVITVSIVTLRRVLVFSFAKNSNALYTISTA